MVTGDGFLQLILLEEIVEEKFQSGNWFYYGAWRRFYAQFVGFIQTDCGEFYNKTETKTVTVDSSDKRLTILKIFCKTKIFLTTKIKLTKSKMETTHLYVARDTSGRRR